MYAVFEVLKHTHKHILIHTEFYRCRLFYGEEYKFLLLFPPSVLKLLILIIVCVCVLVMGNIGTFCGIGIKNF